MIRSLLKGSAKSQIWHSLFAQVRSDRPLTYCGPFFQFKKRGISSLHSQSETRSPPTLFVKQDHTHISTPSIARTSRVTVSAVLPSLDVINFTPKLEKEDVLHIDKPRDCLPDGLGGMYEGDLCNNGLMHGRGKHTLSNGVTYEGTFERGERHGKGIITDQFGAVSESHWQHGKQHGLCTILHANGKSFHGMYEDGKLVSGRGLLRSFQQGACFEGEWIAGKKHGPFTITHTTGETFTGVYENNMAVSGVGTLKSRNGASMSGTWSNGRINGRGKLVYPDGSVYEGELVQNIKYGTGMWRSSRGARYSGSWENGKTHGTGVLTYPNGTTYTGEFLHGKKHGKGVMTNKGKCIAKGMWVNDVKVPVTTKSLCDDATIGGGQSEHILSNSSEDSTADVTSISTTQSTNNHEIHINAICAAPTNVSIATTHTISDTPAITTPTITSSVKPTRALKTIANADGSVYQGAMLNSKYHGKGKLSYTSGATLEGEFREGAIYNGKGVLYVQGAVFEGEWVEGKKNGTFSVTYSSGEVFHGVYKNNKVVNGVGIIKRKDGMSMCGTWVNSKLHGNGKLIYPDGCIYEGELEESVPHGGGEWRCSSSNARYTGTWVKGDKHGYGTLTHSDGAVYTGEFIRDMMHGTGRLSYETEHSIGDYQDHASHKANNYHKGAFLHTNDGVYDGKWKNNRKQGYFIHTLGGARYKVLFKDDEEVKRAPWNRSISNTQATTKATATKNHTTSDSTKSSVVASTTHNVIPTTVYNSALSQNSASCTATLSPATPSAIAPATSSVSTTNSTTTATDSVTTITNADGSVYQGAMLNNKYHGKGKLSYASGATLEGEFREGAIHTGKGVLYMQGAVFEGAWVEGKKHDEGKLTYHNQQTLTGTFVKGKMYNVHGVVYKSDGCKYEGAWVAGRSHGKFKITDRAGKTREVLYNHGKEVHPKTDQPL